MTSPAGDLKFPSHKLTIENLSIYLFLLVFVLTVYLYLYL